MDFKKIITHGGTHHADEILAIATIEHFLGFELEIERTFKVSNEQLADPQILVLDIGRSYNPEKGNFDHHQDGAIAATNMLVLEHFCKDEQLKLVLKQRLFGYVDAVDRGHIIERKEDGFNTPTFNSIVRSLNSMDNGFDVALDFARTALAGVLATAREEIKGMKIWSELRKQNGIAYNESTDFVVGWKELAEDEDILLMISPNLRGGFQIVVRDSDLLTIPIHESQTFRHANGFIAVYPTFEEAESHALSFV